VAFPADPKTLALAPLGAALASASAAPASRKALSSDGRFLVAVAEVHVKGTIGPEDDTDD
jgi:hypothetical protein